MPVVWNNGAYVFPMLFLQRLWREHHTWVLILRWVGSWCWGDGWQGGWGRHPVRPSFGNPLCILWNVCMMCSQWSPEQFDALEFHTSDVEPVHNEQFQTHLTSRFVHFDLCRWYCYIEKYELSKTLQNEKPRRTHVNASTQMFFFFFWKKISSRNLLRCWILYANTQRITKY